MSRLKTYCPSAPMVINVIALFIVLGGQAIALQGKSRVKKDDIAPGAVTARNLGPGIVTSSKLRRRAVTAAALANDSVTGRAIRSGSVNGVSLSGVIQIPAGIPDADPAGDGGDFTWTTSGATATCPPDAKLLNGGVTIQDSATHRGFLQSTYPSSSNALTWVGQISTDTGGASPGHVFAHCLR